MYLRGIDVAKWNRIKDYNALKNAGVDFAILKVINKSNKPDDLFEKHLAGFEKAGIVVQGGYNYTYAFTVQKAIDDAKAFVKVADGRIPMCWLDIEHDVQKGIGQKLVDIILAYKQVIVEAGMTFGVYTGLDFFKRYLKPYANQLQSIPFWIARYYMGYNKVTNVDFKVNETYSPNNDDLGVTIYGWQFTSAAFIGGHDNALDLNDWYIDIEKENTVVDIPKSGYTERSFVEDLEVLKKRAGTLSIDQLLLLTKTISIKQNRNDDIVTLLERLMKAKGFYTGSIEADLGKAPIFGSGMMKAIMLLQTNEVGFKKPDGILTKGGRTYRHIIARGV